MTSILVPSSKSKDALELGCTRLEGLRVMADSLLPESPMVIVLLCKARRLVRGAGSGEVSGMCTVAAAMDGWIGRSMVDGWINV